MEGGLRETALAQPEGVLARQQPVAQVVAEPIVEWTLVIVARVVLQDVPDVGRIREEESVIRPGLQVNDLAITIGGCEKRADRIRAEARKHAHDRVAPRSGRQRRLSIHSEICWSAGSTAPRVPAWRRDPGRSSRRMPNPRSLSPGSTSYRLGMNVPPWTIVSRISALRALHGRALSGVKLSCSESIIGRGSTGA